MRLLVSTAAVPAWRRSLTAVSALWVSALRLFVVTALTVAAVLRWRDTVGACLLLTSETTWLLAAMWLLTIVAAGRVV
jgi:hypothetical protein